MSNGIGTGDGVQNTEALKKPAADPRVQRRDLGLWPSIILAIVVAALSFGGSTLGSYLADVRASAQWKREFTAEWRQQILQERIDIIERTVLAMNNRDSIHKMMSVIEAMTTELSVAILEDEPSHDGPVSAEDMLPVLEQRLRVNEMAREFSAAVSLCAIYFGPRTLDAVAAFEEHAGSWWEIDSAAFDELADALWAELSYGF